MNSLSSKKLFLKDVLLGPFCGLFHPFFKSSVVGQVVNKQHNFFAYNGNRVIKLWLTQL